MRLNVYSEELTKDVAVVTKTADTGRQFYGLRFTLESAWSLHHGTDDDDRSAVTLWAEDLDTLRNLMTLAYDAIIDKME